MTTDRQHLAQQLRARAFLTGRFTLRSGATSAVYWDKYRFEAEPVLLAAVARALAGLLPPAYDRLAGLELGGVPLATALALHTGRPALFVRKAAKPYGTANLAEGGFAPGEQAVIVEDVVTTAGQVLASLADLRALGLTVRHAVCVIDREEGGAQRLAAAGCALTPLFTMAELDRLAPAASGGAAGPGRFPTPDAGRSRG
jgi:orotate phosphoribosyltransferase